MAPVNGFSVKASCDASGKCQIDTNHPIERLIINEGLPLETRPYVKVGNRFQQGNSYIDLTSPNFLSYTRGSGSCTFTLFRKDPLTAEDRQVLQQIIDDVDEIAPKETPSIEKALVYARVASINGNRQLIERAIRIIDNLRPLRDEDGIYYELGRYALAGGFIDLAEKILPKMGLSKPLLALNIAVAKGAKGAAFFTEAKAAAKYSILDDTPQKEIAIAMAKSPLFTNQQALEYSDTILLGSINRGRGCVVTTFTGRLESREEILLKMVEDGEIDQALDFVRFYRREKVTGKDHGKLFARHEFEYTIIADGVKAVILAVARRGHFDKALKATREVLDKRLRAELLSEIGILKRDRTLLTEARDIDPGYGQDLRSGFISKLVGLGWFGEAEVLIRRTRFIGTEWGSHYMYPLLDAYLEQGEFLKAFSLADVGGGKGKAEAKARVIETVARVDGLKAAEKYVTDMTEPLEKVYGYNALALVTDEETAKKKYLEKALKIARAIPIEKGGADEMNDEERPLYYDQIKEVRALAVESVVLTYAKLGDWDGAVSIIRAETPRPDTEIEAKKRAEGYMILKAWDKGHKAVVVTKCAELLAKAGEGEKAIQALNSPLCRGKDVHREVDCLCRGKDVHREVDCSYGLVADALYENGEVERAIFVIQEERKYFWKSRRLREFAEDAASKGKFQLAFDIIRRIDSHQERSQALKSVAGMVRKRKIEAPCPR